MSEIKPLATYDPDHDQVYMYPRTKTIEQVFGKEVVDKIIKDVDLSERDVFSAISVISGLTDYIYDEPKHRTGKKETEIMEVLLNYDAVRIKYGAVDDYWFYIKDLDLHVVRNWGTLKLVSCGETAHVHEQMILQLLEKLTTSREDKKQVPSINLLMRGAGGFYTEEYQYKEKIVVDLATQYSEGMEKFHERVVKSMENDTCGLHILHGAPGTGKSTYIKYLSSQVQMPFYYMTPETIGNLSQPHFLADLIDYKKGVFIIEEAEQLLKSRKNTSSGAISSLLNMSSGVIGDVLGSHVICTFNCPKEEIDDALLRKGRLRSIIELKPLSKQKCKALGFEVDKPTPIADLYNEDPGEIEKQAKIGFRHG